MSGGTITDMDGNFSLEVNSNATLIISYIGFHTLEIPVNNQTALTITLREDIQALDDVVVIGYGTQKKEDLSSSIAVLPVKDLSKVPGGLQAGLQSSVPGGTGYKRQNSHTWSWFYQQYGSFVCRGRDDRGCCA